MSVVKKMWECHGHNYFSPQFKMHCYSSDNSFLVYTVLAMLLDAVMFMVYHESLIAMIATSMKGGAGAASQATFQ